MAKFKVGDILLPRSKKVRYKVLSIVNGGYELLLLTNGATSIWNFDVVDNQSTLDEASVVDRILEKYYDNL